MATCESCGREIQFEGDDCVFCRAERAAANDAASGMALRLIASLVADAVMYEGVHPEDVRQIVDVTLGRPELAGCVGMGRSDELSREAHETREALAKAAVS